MTFLPRFQIKLNQGKSESESGVTPGKSTRVGCHFLLQGIFPTQGSNPGLLHCRQVLYHLSHQGSPETGEKNFWDPPHITSIHALSHPICYHRKTLHDSIVRTALISLTAAHITNPPISPVPRMICRRLLFWKETLSTSLLPQLLPYLSSRPFTAKLLLKSCIYSQYLIHMLPFSMKPTLIRV